MATYIKTLLEYSTGDTIYPKTKSDAVYRTDNVTVAETTLAAADTHIANTNNPHNVTATQLNVYTKTEIDNAGYLTSIPKASSSVLGGIKIGSGLTISSGGVVSVTGGGVADSVAWGHITGTLADQTDLNNILSTIPTNVSDLPNDAGYITGITSSDVTNALGYTPYSSANPNGYTSNIGTITSVKTTAGTHNTINVTSGSVSFNVPTKTSHLNNDSGFITTETDPVFSASAAASINASDITNWNNKTSNVGTITGVSINSTSIATSGVANITSIPLSIISDASDLKAIEALTGTSGLLKKTATNTWSLDTNTYLTSYTETDPVFSASAAYGISSSDITNWNSKTSNTGTVTKVTAGTGLKIGTASSGGDITTSGTINHINSVTAQTTQAVYPIKIDAQGHISAYGTAVTIVNTRGTATSGGTTLSVVNTGDMYTWNNKQNKATTLAGYGITDAKIESGTITLGSNTITPLTSFTETDPVFSASVAAGITATDITNWNNKVSDDKTWNGVSLTKSFSSTMAAGYVPYVSATTDTSANYYPVAKANVPAANAIPKYNSGGYLSSNTPSSNDNSTKVATTSFVKTALSALDADIGELRTDMATAQIDIFALDSNKFNAGQDIYSGSSLDFCTQAGWYYIDPSITTINIPDASSSWGILEVIRTSHNDAGAVLQRFTAVDDGITYTRYDANATGLFTEWHKMG